MSRLTAISSRTRSWPNTSTRPSSSVSRPETSLISVDLPEPLAPRIPIVPPRSRRSETSAIATTGSLLARDVEALGDPIDEQRGHRPPAVATELRRPGSGPRPGWAATLDRAVDPAPSSVSGAWCSSLVDLLVEVGRTEEPRTVPAPGGGLAARSWVPCAARDKRKTVGPIWPTVRGFCWRAVLPPVSYLEVGTNLPRPAAPTGATSSAASSVVLFIQHTSGKRHPTPRRRRPDGTGADLGARQAEAGTGLG